MQDSTAEGEFALLDRYATAVGRWKQEEEEEEDFPASMIFALRPGKGWRWNLTTRRD